MIKQIFEPFYHPLTSSPVSMSTFPWENVKAETLRSVCKDLGAASGVKRNRERMITFLKDLEQGGSATVDGESSSEMLETPDTIQAATILASLQSTGSDDMDPETSSDADMDSDSDTACVNGCQQGWLSPRLKFILQTTAVIAHDMVRDSGDLAIEFADAGHVYLAEYIPSEDLPRDKQDIAQWIQGFAMIFKVISEIFEAGRIPNVSQVEQTLVGDEAKLKFYQMYAMKGADCRSVLEALVCGAREDWESGHFRAAHCDSKPEWEALPLCAEHDVDWLMAEAALSD
ncbi:hypothetical protein DFH09DRAFT_1471684 [Mycena vulgaris]|nr:hypothetical protein DFH09DRAFT_1471684 [Mycena vulgaris]